MKIAIIDDYQRATPSLRCMERLADHELVVFSEPELDDARFAARLEGCEVLLMIQQRSKLSRARVEALPRSVALICNTGRSVGHIDLEACAARGLVVCSAGGGRPWAVAELTWALILASMRHIPAEVAGLRAGRWQTTLGEGLHGKRLGIYALGRIGTEVARVGAAFGMQVCCWGRAGTEARARELGYAFAPSRERFFAEADVLSLHLPLNQHTRGIVGAEDLARMQPTALLVNTSRAELIAEGALLEALDAGRPGAAAVDVYEREPVLGGEHPLLARDNVLCTPHLGYVERDTYETYFSGAVDCILAYASGRPIHVVPPTGPGKSA
ncbi:MAG: D-2-hydroxyacid dehydrogenase family protein [Myxococcales bacterium]|nr:D-2-hydroxyacid dehydrogenase family protein [Myxococcales bacterium]